MGLLPLVVDKLRQDSKLHDANMSKSTFGTKNVPAYSQFMFQYVYYCKQVYFQQEQSKLSGEIAFFSNLRKRGFQSGLKEENVNIPEDISLITFDDNPYLNYIEPPLTCISQPVEDICKIAVKILFSNILDHDKTPKHVLLKSTLKVKASVRNLSYLR